MYETWAVFIISALCSAGNGTIFVQSRGDRTILHLDTTNPALEGQIYRTFRPDVRGLAMCYIPPPVDVLVLSDEYSLKVVALSFDKNEVISDLLRFIYDI